MKEEQKPKIHLNNPEVTEERIPKEGSLPKVPITEFIIDSEQFVDLGNGGRKAKNIPGQP